MGHPRDPVGHSHHNSVWISHQKVNDESFWEDGRGPRIVQEKVLRMDDRDEQASVETENAWIAKDGTPLLRELRRTTVHALPAGEWMLCIDVQFEARERDVQLGETAFGPIGVRMAKTIGVADGGGTIRNSEGGVDEEGCFRKAARWCDYSGPITADASEGITLMDHPMNPHHPVPFHVRNDGWMGAALTFPGALMIAPGEPLRLRYGLYIHAGIPLPGAIERQWEEFSRTEFAPFSLKKRK
jgi:Methane oxygenase PmoA